MRRLNIGAVEPEISGLIQPKELKPIYILPNRRDGKSTTKLGDC